MKHYFPNRRLSWVRVAVAFLLLALIGAAGASGLRAFNDARTATGKSWFAGYVDVTATPRYAFETPKSRSGRDVVLSFVVAGKTAPCTPTWGAAYDLDAASSGLDLDRRIARLRQTNGSVIASFGGQANRELASACTDPAALKAAYAKVIDRYELNTVDVDIEGSQLDDAAANRRRGAVLAEIQRERRASGKPLAVWLTLPVGTSGLSEAGTTAVADTLGAGVTIAGVNVMTMDFGSSLARQQSLARASISALENTHRQLMVLWHRAGEQVGPATTWKRMGATPMLGQNDVRSEVFTEADATKLNAYALRRGLGRLSVWSLNRDRSCGANYADPTVVSDSCSGVTQDAGAFGRRLGHRLTGVPDRAGDRPEVPEVSSPMIIDDPKTSPYPIWNADKAYLAGTKIVWKRNVYIAKWWTSGDTPDNPVLQAYETPWTLVGPVLPGEKPIPVLRVPAGTYPAWRPKAVYRRGDRVLFEGIGFQAKWWTQGDNPLAGGSARTAEAGVTTDTSPWAQLTDRQVRDVLQAQSQRR